jgi:GT2 family glycosyltransferase
MTKTLAVILHYNTPEITDRLYEQLKPFENDDYDLVVLDNGSSTEGISKYTTYRCDSNVYFGGGLNLAMNLILENSQYDSLLFLNSDLIIHGYRFVKTLRKEMFEILRTDTPYKIISPSVIQPEKNQCFWPTMHNWSANVVRDVPWIDFQCPLIHRDLIEEINQFDTDLIFGWGNDVYSGVICTEKGWRMGVVDWCSVIHLSNETVRQNANNPIIKNYNVYAEQGMVKFFNKIDKIKELIDLRNRALNYRYEG